MTAPAIITEPVVACADLIRRAGGTAFEIGYLDADVPVAEARWWATARWKGTLISADDHTSPGGAADALAARILIGGQCTHCEQPILIHQHTIEHRHGFCYWYRQEDRWLWGCGPGAPT